MLSNKSTTDYVSKERYMNKLPSELLSLESLSCAAISPARANSSASYGSAGILKYQFFNQSINQTHNLQLYLSNKQTIQTAMNTKLLNNFEDWVNFRVLHRLSLWYLINSSRIHVCCMHLPCTLNDNKAFNSSFSVKGVIGNILKAFCGRASGSCERCLF